MTRVDAVPQGFYAYVFRDPRSGEPFYVGKGVKGRYRRHLKYFGTNRILHNKIRQIRVDGREPQVEVILALDESHAFFLESCLIDIFGRRDLGAGPLLNYTNGGEGSSGRQYRHSPESRSKIGDAIRGKKFSEEHRANLSAASRRRYEEGEGRKSLDFARSARHASPPTEDAKRRMAEAQRNSPGHAERMARLTLLAAAANKKNRS